MLNVLSKWCLTLQTFERLEAFKMVLVVRGMETQKFISQTHKTNAWYTHSL